MISGSATERRVGGEHGERAERASAMAEGSGGGIASERGGNGGLTRMSRMRPCGIALA